MDDRLNIFEGLLVADTVVGVPLNRLAASHTRLGDDLPLVVVLLLLGLGSFLLGLLLLGGRRSGLLWLFNLLGLLDLLGLLSLGLGGLLLLLLLLVLLLGGLLGRHWLCDVAN